LPKYHSYFSPGCFVSSDGNIFRRWRMLKKRVLLGLDAESAATAMNFFSNREKFAVTFANDGRQAVRGIEEERPDLAILDIRLPKGGGDYCCKRSKQADLSPGTIIVLLVSTENSGEISRSLDAGCDALLLKPLTNESLSGLVTRLLFAESKSVSRFQVRVPVLYRVAPHVLTGNYSVDLTSGGMFIETQEVVPVCTPLQVAFTLPGSNDTTIHCIARVAWLNDPAVRRTSLLPPGMGLEFVDMDKSQTDAIRQYLLFRE
jgi:uncharacterized protein (TIGR02266 family)